MSTKTAREIRSAALALTARERAELAAVLLESLDEAVDVDAEQAWHVEVERRLESLESGGATVVEADTVLARLRARAGGVVGE